MAESPKIGGYLIKERLWRIISHQSFPDLADQLVVKAYIIPPVDNQPVRSCLGQGYLRLGLVRRERRDLFVIVFVYASVVKRP